MINSGPTQSEVATNSFTSPPAIHPNQNSVRLRSEGGECHRDMGADISPSEAGQRSQDEKACSERDDETIRYRHRAKDR